MIEDGSSFKPAVLELGDIQEGVGLFGLEVYEETGWSLLEGHGGGGDVLADASHDVRKDDKSDESQGRKREEEGMCWRCLGYRETCLLQVVC